jgi:polyribonucleotide nucleotidyltransferase
VNGKDEVLFGVAMKEGEGADATVMGVTDQSALRHTAHLPYEMLVSGNRVYTLHGKFRIAQSFPDLTMSTFMKISGAPDAIEKVLKEVASAK